MTAAPRRSTPGPRSPRDEQALRRLRWRMGIVLALPALLTLVVVAKVVLLQQFQGERLRKAYERRLAVMAKEHSGRGAIRDRRGQVLAATAEIDQIALRPKKLPGDGSPGAREELATLFSRALERPLELMREKVASPRGYVRLSRYAEARQVSQLLGGLLLRRSSVLDLPTQVSIFLARSRKWAAARTTRAADLILDGVVFEKAHKRFWPTRGLAGQVLGFVDVQDHGVAGVERTFDSVLAGREYTVAALRDAADRPIYSAGLQKDAQLEGGTVVLTIDSVIQQIAEEELRAGVEAAGAKRGVALVLDPGTNDILAMAQYPGFDPSGSRSEHALYRNWATEDIYEPGSVMKVFTLGAAYEAGVVRPATLIDCEKGRYRIGRHVIHDHAPEGVITAQEVLTVSSNVGIAKIAEMLGKERLHGALRALGLNGRLEVRGLGADQPGMLAPPRRWANITLANVAFGQGIAVTPLQLASAMSTVAKGGERLRPRLVQRVEDARGRVVQEFPPEPLGRPLGARAAAQLRDALVSVVYDEGGTGSKARIPGFTVAGKTGTAQKVEDRRYVDRWVGSFVGFVPAEAPALTILVSIDEPEPVHYGGVVAAPVFARIGSRTLTHLGIFGRPEVAEAKPAPRRAARRRPAAADSAAKAEGAVVEQLPAPREAPPGTVPMPDFAGLSMTAALARAEAAGLALDLSGSGRVARQEPAAGEFVLAGSVGRLEFDPGWPKAALEVRP